MAIATVASTAFIAGCQSATFRPPNLAGGARQFVYEHQIQAFRLSNGLDVLILPESNTNLVKVDVRYRVGAAEDPPNKSGLAHMTEHMAFEMRPLGTNGPTLNEMFAQISLHHNAYTIWDETHYTSIGMANQLTGLLTMEARRMGATCAMISEGKVAREREIVLNEIRERSGGVSGEIGRIIYGEVYGKKHVYGRAVGGSEADVRGLKRRDICRFMDRYYGPNTAILVISGSVEVDEAIDSVAKLFGNIPAAKQPDRNRVSRPELSGTQSRHQIAVDEATAVIVSNRPVFVDEEAIVDEFLADLLRQQLYAAVREQSFVTNVFVSDTGGVRAPVRSVGISVDDPARLDEAVDLVFTVRDKLTDDLNEIALAHMRERRRADVIFAAEPFMRSAGMHADFQQYGGRSDLLVNMLLRIDNIDEAAIKRWLPRFLPREQSHVAVFTPDPDAVVEKERVVIYGEAKIDELPAESIAVDVDEADRSLTIPGASQADQSGGDGLPGVTRKLVAVRDITLANGMRVLLAPSLSQPVVDIRIMFRGGTLNEPSDKPGIATLSRVLLEKDLNPPLKTLKDVDDFQTVLRMGGEINRSGDETTTTFRNSGLSIYADGLLWELHWLLESGSYSEGTLKNWREISERIESPGDRIGKRRIAVIERALLGDAHPYARPAPGAAEWRTISIADLESFRGSYYRAQGATLIATGKFDVALFESKLRELFGRWPRAQSPMPPPPREVPAAQRRREPGYFAIEEDSDVQINVMFAYAIRPGFREYHAARMVLAEMLRYRLKRLRHQLGVSYGATVQHVQRSGPGFLLIGASIDRNRAAQGLSAMREAIGDLRGDWDGHELRMDFVRARRKVLQRTLADSLHSRSVADELEFIATFDLELNYYEGLAASVAKLRPVDIADLVSEEMPTVGEVIVASGRMAALEAMYRGAGITQYRAIE